MIARLIVFVSLALGASVLAPSIASAQHAPSVTTTADEPVPAAGQRSERPPADTSVDTTQPLVQGVPREGGVNPPVDEQGAAPGEPQPPVYATWWFWAAVSAIALGIVAAVIVDVTTDDPDPEPRTMTLVGVRF